MRRWSLSLLLALPLALGACTVNPLHDIATGEVDLLDDTPKPTPPLQAEPCAIVTNTTARLKLTFEEVEDLVTPDLLINPNSTDAYTSKYARTLVEIDMTRNPADYDQMLGTAKVTHTRRGQIVFREADPVCGEGVNLEYNDRIYETKVTGRLTCEGDLAGIRVGIEITPENDGSQGAYFYRWHNGCIDQVRNSTVPFTWSGYYRNVNARPLATSLEYRQDIPVAAPTTGEFYQEVTISLGAQ